MSKERLPQMVVKSTLLIVVQVDAIERRDDALFGKGGELTWHRTFLVCDTGRPDALEGLHSQFEQAIQTALDALPATVEQP